MPSPSRPRCASPCASGAVPWGGMAAGDRRSVGGGRVALPAGRRRGGPHLAPRPRPPREPSPRRVLSRSPGQPPQHPTSSRAAPVPRHRVAGGRHPPASPVARRRPCTGSSGGGRGSRPRGTTRSPVRCSWPTRWAPAPRWWMPCAPGSVPPPRSRPPCSTPPRTGMPLARSSPSSTPPSPGDPAAVRRALPPVLAIGHTSGADTVTGIRAAPAVGCSAGGQRSLLSTRWKGRAA